ncbi:MAG: PEP-CTERM sorting domain-containing protein [Pirellulales bacterium]|nr:PEP-CTERM sorting domain-containing protein [Pirellulales bacterium]
MERRCLFAALLLLAACVSVSTAAPISYGNLSGTTVDFLGVTEDSGTDPTPLYGAPTVVDDALLFSPVSFNAFAQALNPPVDLTDGVLTMTLVAQPGNTIPGISIAEFGDYTLGGVGTTTTQVSAQASVFATILEVNGAAIAPLTLVKNLFTPATLGQFDLVNDAGVAVPWAGQVALDIQGFLAGKGINGSATKVQLSMDNSLQAVSEAASTAFIAKKGLIIGIPIIPEPSTLVLLAMGLAGVCAVRLGRR